MIINRLHLQNFRNHVETDLQFGRYINIITGPNGSGKTNLIDAIHYLCMSRSFVATSDRYVVNNDSSFFFIKGEFSGQIRSEFEVTCTYSAGEGKKLFVNDGPLDRFSDLIGMVPVVVLSPADRALTREGPSERRSFIDSFISQISSTYLKHLVEFKRIVKQRNTLLQDFNGPRDLLIQYLEPWDKQLAEVGSKIIAKRTKVLNNFHDYLENIYKMITGMTHIPNFTYQTICDPDTNHEVLVEKYQEKIADKQNYEIDRELTTIGPHRDEIVFYLNDMELRKYGSQGQHRLFALSLKLSQLFYYSDELEDLPIFLLDDVFGDLDEGRTQILLEALAKYAGQVFITSAAPLPFDDYIDFDTANNCRFHFKNGNVEKLVTT